GSQAATATSVERPFVRVRDSRGRFLPTRFHSMLGDPKPETAKLDGPPQGDGKLDVPEARRGALLPAKILALVLVAGPMGAGAYRLFVGPFGRAQSAPAAVEKVQLLIRSGQRVTVPEGSPLRAKLAIHPAVEQDIKRSLVLPAVVDADPVRL